MHSYEFGGREKKVFGLGMKEKWVVRVVLTKGHLHTSKETLTI